MKRTSYTSAAIVPGPLLSGPITKIHWTFLQKIADARENLDPEVLINVLDEDAIYESQDALNPLAGRAVIGEYLRSRFELFAQFDAGAPRVRMIPGVVDLPAATAHPCLIVSVDGKRQALWAIKLNELNTKVLRIDILTTLPEPGAAVTCPPPVPLS